MKKLLLAITLITLLCYCLVWIKIKRHNEPEITKQDAISQKTIDSLFKSDKK